MFFQYKYSFYALIFISMANYYFFTAKLNAKTSPNNNLNLILSLSQEPKESEQYKTHGMQDLENKAANYYTEIAAKNAAHRNEEPDLLPLMDHLNKKLHRYLIEKEIKSASDMLKLLIAFSAIYNTVIDAIWNEAPDASFQALNRVTGNINCENVVHAISYATYEATRASASSSPFNDVYDIVFAPTWRFAADSNAQACHDAYYSASAAALNLVAKAPHKAAFISVVDKAENSKINILRIKLMARISHRMAEWASLTILIDNLEIILDTALKSAENQEFTLTNTEISEQVAKFESAQNKTVKLILSPYTNIIKDHLDSLDLFH